ncbi:MAG: hypothetical protein V3R51_03350, partial [Gammaproteobacteria bacterium]
MTKTIAVCRGQAGLLLLLFLWISVCPYAFAVPSAAGSSELEPFVMEVTSVSRGRGKNWAEVSITVRINDPSIKRITITSQAPDGMAVKPPVQNLILGQEGNVSARFRLYKSKGDWADLGALSFIASGDVNGLIHTVETTVEWPVGLVRENLFHRPPWFWLITVITVVLIPLLSRRVRCAISTGYQKLYDIRLLLELFTLVVVGIFIISKVSPELLLTSTITTGGDTASHYYTLQYLRDVLLPSGQVSGWTPGNYAGFPILQFYFPLVFLFMTLLSGIMPLQVAFKLGSMSGILLLPACVYGMLRLIRCPFPGPGIGAALTLPFLFNSSHSMWGGNILSSFAGEFSYGLSMALSLILLGSLYRGVRDNRGVIVNGILVFLVGFSHGYTLLFVEAMSLYLLITPRDFIQRLFYLGKVYTLAFFLLAFWIVPLLVFTKYTTSYDLVWTINSMREIFPPILVPSLLAGALGTVGLLVGGSWKFRGVGKELLSMVGYLWFGLAMAVVFFVAAPRLGVVDIRYVPYGHLIGTLLAATALGWLGWSLRRWKVDWVL